MRKQRGGFWRKAFAVMLSAVLCVGLAVGTGAVNARAAEGTQTSRLTLRFADYEGTPSSDVVRVDFIDDENSYLNLYVSKGDGTVTYTTGNLQTEEKTYYWMIDGEIIIEIGKDSEVYTFDLTLYPVNFWNGSSIWRTQYVRSGAKATPPVAKPSKQDFTFMGWKTKYGAEFPFSTESIVEPTDIYAAWRRTLTDAALQARLEYALRYMSVSNGTSKTDVLNYVKRRIDSDFEIHSAVEVTVFEPTYATSEGSGSLELGVSVAQGGFSANLITTKTIPILPTVEQNGWMLDSAGRVTIASQAGMNDWTRNGNPNNKELVKEVVIQDGVTAIPDNAFSGDGNLKSVSVPNSVTSIGNAAFAGVSSLEEITLSPNLYSIGNGAFSGCTSLGKVVLQGNTPPLLGNFAFEQCKFTTDLANTDGIVVPAGSVGTYKQTGGAFWEYIKAEYPEITADALDRKAQEIIDSLPVSNDTTANSVMQEVKKGLDGYFQTGGSIRMISSGGMKATAQYDGFFTMEMEISYSGYSVTKQINRTIPRLSAVQGNGWTLDEAGNLAIVGQEGMDDWVLNGRTEEELPAVKNVVIGEGVTEIPANAFSGCGNLGSVSIPNTVTGIGNLAFAGDSALGAVTLPPNLQSLGDGAFSGCGSLGEVVMQGVMPPASVGDGVFDGCKFTADPAGGGGIAVPPGSEDIYKSVGGVFGEYIKTEKPGITQEALDERLQEILGTLWVPGDSTQETVRDVVKKGIDEYFGVDSAITVAGFTVLKEATVEEEGLLELAVTVRCGEFFSTVEGNVPIARLSPLPDRGWTMDGAGNLVIASQAGMDDWASGGRAEGLFPAVKSILLKSGVTGIPDDAFSGCCDLATVEIPDTVTCIGSLAFKHASSLSEITLPQNLQSIGDSAFEDCSSLERVVMQGNTPPTLGAAVFARCKFETDSSRGIVVPRDCEDAYKSAWGTLGAYILDKHTHSYAAEWSYDESGHWHGCACGGKGDMADHTWDGGTVSQEPSETEPGAICYICSVCGMEKTESIPATGDGNGGNGGGSGDGGSGGNGAGSGGGGSGGNGDGNGGSGGNGDGTPSVSGNGNPGGSVSGNDNPGGGSVSGNDSQIENGSGGDPSGSGGNNRGNGSDGGNVQPPSDSSGDIALLWNTLTGNTFSANTPRDREPGTSDGVSLSLYATVAMVAGFFYLLLLFLDKYDIAKAEKRESLARLVRWAKGGGRLRKLPVMAVLLVMRTYYRMVGDGKTDRYGQ